jgi:hypothetical protein
VILKLPQSRGTRTLQNSTAETQVANATEFRNTFDVTADIAGFSSGSAL